MPLFKPYSQNQLQLLPPSINELIAKDHIARLISRAVDTMDFTAIENTYSIEGQHGYYPKMLVKVLLYGYTTGVRSSRQLADKLHEDVAYMWLSGRQTPDFRTISDFRKDRLGDIKQLFKQVLDICAELGMIRLGAVSIDGTTIRADANKNKMQYRKLLEKRKQGIRKQIDEMFEEADRLDEEEEKLYGNMTPHTTGKPLTDEMKEEIKEQMNREFTKQANVISRRKATLKRQEKKLKARQQELNGKLRMIRKDRNSMSSTDKDATYMLMKEQYTAPGYNVQLATEHQVILAYGVFSDRNDSRLMKPLIEEVKKLTGAKPRTTIADAGYGNKKTYRYLKQQKIAAFIPYNNYNKEMTERNKGLYTLPKNYDTELERYKFQQRLRLASEEGKQLMKRRREDIEPAIGDIKRNMGFRRFNLRGKRKCETELGLVSIGHNLKKVKEWVRKLAEWENGLLKGQELGKVLGYVTA